MGRGVARHLVGTIVDRPLGAAWDELVAARAYLVGHARRALARAAGEGADEGGGGWASRVKRVPVELAGEGRPALVPAAVTSHSLVEVLNQCATLDRLLDAIAFVRADARLKAFDHVVRCHPTTSSSRPSATESAAGARDNDLILAAEDGRRARFEVSDVASTKDGNDKELRDLISLGVLSAGGGGGMAARLGVARWPSDLLFLVVSREFGRGVLLRRRAWIAKRHLAYRPIEASEGTVMLEVVRGEGFAGE